MTIKKVYTAKEDEILVMESEYGGFGDFRLTYRYDLATKGGDHLTWATDWLDGHINKERARKIAIPALKEQMLKRNIKPEDLVSPEIIEGVKSEMIKA